MPCAPPNSKFKLRSRLRRVPVADPAGPPSRKCSCSPPPPPFQHRSMAASLQQEFDVDGAQLGALSSAYFWPYLGMQFVLGYLFLRFGVDAVVCASMAIAATGSLVFALSESLGVAVLGRCLIGSGVAAAWLGVVTVAQGPAFEKAGLSTTVTGAGVLFGLAGALIAQTPLTSAIELFGFRPVLLWSTVAPAVVAAAFFVRALIGAGVCCRGVDAAKDRGAIQAVDGGRAPALDALLDGHEAASDDAAAVEGLAETKPEAPPTVMAAYWAALRSPILLPVVLYGFGIAAPLLAFASLWATPFFEDVYDLDKPTASGVVSAFLVGWGVGGPALGWVVDRLGGGPRGAQWVMMLCPVVGGVALTPVLLADLPVWAAATLMAVAGLASCIAIVLAYTRLVIVRPEGRATAVAIVNAAMILAGASLQPAIGLVLDGVAGGRIHELPSGRKVYPPDAYRWALMVLPGCYVLSTLSFAVAWCVCGHGMARKEHGDGPTPPLLARPVVGGAGKP